MTEAEWLNCTDPAVMLAFVEDKASARMFRLYHCAVLRQFWFWLEPFGWQAIEATEQHFDTPGGSRRPAVQRRANKEAREETLGHLVEKLSLIVSNRSLECVAILRCTFGNPFHPITISPAIPAWNHALVVRLAQAAYEDRHLPAGTLDGGRLAILADALEEAGCTSEDVLGHLRGPGPHVRGCWPVDLCLGKS